MYISSTPLYYTDTQNYYGTWWHLACIILGMNQQRAKYLVRNIRNGSPRFSFGKPGSGILTFPDGITREENAHLESLTGNLCFMGVLYAIASGKKISEPIEQVAA